MKSDSCERTIVFPSGGYNYPSRILNDDSTLMLYQIKDSAGRDSFIYAYTGYHFLKSFEEPNLSIRPHSEILFRISYESFGDKPFVITMSCNKIIFKIGTSGDPSYPFEDTNRLTETERFHYNILRRNFPIDLDIYSERKRYYFDSLIQLYPDLLLPSYYRHILEKSLDYDSMPFNYSRQEIELSTEKFLYFVDLINQSGFWDMPYRVSYEPSPNDGGGYILEANTPKKFKFVVSSNCPEKSEKLTKVCQEIIDFVVPRNKKIRLCG